MQGELQDMGVMWARAGCLVLVMDQLGPTRLSESSLPAPGASSLLALSRVDQVRLFPLKTIAACRSSLRDLSRSAVPDDEVGQPLSK
jgi:hypothetical protein